MAKQPKTPAEDKADGGTAAPAPEASGPAQQPAPQSGDQPQLSVLTQFVRDLSFESPNAPAAMQGPGANPKLQLNINVQANKRGDDVFEASLHFDARASNDTGVIYNIELVYGGLFRLRNIPDNVLRGVLFVDCPTLLFPFLRRIVSQLTQDGGYPPLLLDPIDFATLYRNNLQQQQAQAAGGAASPGQPANS